MQKDFIRGFCLLSLMLAMLSCQPDQKAKEETTQDKKQVSVPVFNRDTAYHFVGVQVQMGTRQLGSPGHQLCGDWIVEKLNQYGAEVQEQHFEATLYTQETFPATNIIGYFNKSASKRVVLAAHWDTRHIADQDPDVQKRDHPILGADDGASGVAVLLEVARVLGQNPTDIGVDLVFFDAEDSGQSGGGQDETWCLGSQYWARHLSDKDKPQYGILIDMVGSKGATFPKEGISLHYARNIVDKVWDLANRMGYGHYFVNKQIGPLTDDHTFVNKIANFPMIDIVNHSNGRFGTYWHTHDDNMDIIDKSSLRVVGQVLLAVIYRESAEVL